MSQVRHLVVVADDDFPGDGEASSGEPGVHSISSRTLEEYQRRLTAYGRRLVRGKPGQEHSVEEAVQSAFGTFIRRRRTGSLADKSEGELVGWLLRVLRNKLIKRVFPTGPRGNETNLSDMDFAGMSTPEFGPRDIAVARDLLEHLSSRFPPRDMEVVERLLAGYSQQEIAELMKLSDRHVRRIMVKLRRHAESWREASA